MLHVSCRIAGCCFALLGAVASVVSAAEPGAVRVTLGPYVQQVSRDRFLVLWETDRPVRGSVQCNQRGVHDTGRGTGTSAELGTRHRLSLHGLARETAYEYRIVNTAADETSSTSGPFTFDTGLDYLPPDTPAATDEAANHRDTLVRHWVDVLLPQTKITRGYCLILGSGEGRLALELARRTQLQIVAVDDDPQAVAAARDRLVAAGVYGTRVTVHQRSLEKLPYVDYLANLIVSERLLTEGKLPGAAREVARLLRPAGGVAYLGTKSPTLDRAKMTAWLQAGGVTPSELRDGDGVTAIIRRGDLPGAGEWSHQYGGADNAACSHDELLRGDTQVLWFGQPGPRPMVDRGARTPAPLAVGGRLFVQGDRILFGLDAYNGSILWVLHVPMLHRANVPRDTSNMAAGRDALFVAVDDACWKLDPASGDRLAAWPVVRPQGSNDKQPYDWGYVGRIGEQVIGSAVKRGSAYKAGNGEWFDTAQDHETRKVLSDGLFALDPQTGAKRWEYTGQILNSTITSAGGRMYFVETRNPAVAKSTTGRQGREALAETYLVAIDEGTGRRLWESPTDLSKFRRVCYLSHDGNTLVAVGSSDKYYVKTFAADTGQLRWSREFAWTGPDDHGRAMQHPTIVGGTVYTEFQAFDLTTGQPRPGLPMRGHGCGAQSASSHAFFYRGGFHTMWNIGDAQQQVLAPARSGCWLSLIPAGGILLAPETSSGCSCTHALQTSMAFLPTAGRKDAPLLRRP